jgi:DNA-binding NarL/FixJ family response regulator
MDLQLPKLDGISAMGELKRAGSFAAIIILSAVADCRRMREAAAAGVVSFILKDTGPDAIVTSIRTAAWQRQQGPTEADVAPALKA